MQGDLPHGMLDGSWLFSLWARIDPAKVMPAAVWESARSEGQRSVANCYGDCRDCASKGVLVNMAYTWSWKEIPRLLERLPDFVVAGSAALATGDDPPSPQRHYCERHGLFNGEGVGCVACAEPWDHPDLPGVRERLHDPWRQDRR